MEKQVKRIVSKFPVGSRTTAEGEVQWLVEVALEYKVATGHELTVGLDRMVAGAVYPVLTISGEEQERLRADGQTRLMACGQVHDLIATDLHKGALNQPHLFLQALLNLWHDWHLNDMNAGCQHQREAGWDLKRCGEKCPKCGYEWGSKWLVRPLPKAVEDQIIKFITEPR